MQPVPHASRTARSKPGLYNAELGYCNKELYEYELSAAGLRRGAGTRCEVGASPSGELLQQSAGGLREAGRAQTGGGVLGLT